MPPDWPDPPLLEYLLFESPWGLMVALLAVAAGIFLAGGRGGRRHVQQAAAVPLVAAVALPILAHFVRTDAERMRANTRRLVEAISDPLDMQTLRFLTADDARLLQWDREQLLRVARRASELVEITDYTITNLMVRRGSGRYGKTYVAVIGRANYRGGFGSGFKTSWVLNWRKGDGGKWQLSAVDEVHVNGRDAEDILRSFVH